MDVRRVIGENVRRFRLAADLSQEAVAERMGVDRAYVSALEQGTRNPTVITLDRVAEALGVKPARLLDDEPAGEEVVPAKRKRAPKRIG
jgi:transcriptional regulator with XRE-family HTH domain